MRRLAYEKLPLLLLSMASSIATLYAQHSTSPIVSLERLAVLPRLINACLSYVIYFRQALWPSGLAAFYPYPIDGFQLLPVLISLAVLAGLSFVVHFQRRVRPWLFAGWCWYLGMLVPVIGVIQVGEQARADRYAYLPMIGIWIGLAWTTNAWAACARQRLLIHHATWLVFIAVMAICAGRQTTFWKNSETLWTRSIDSSPPHHLPVNNLGNAFFASHRLDEAMASYEEALRLKPDYAFAHNNAGNVLLLKGRTGEAIAHYEQALQVSSRFDRAHNNLASALLQQGRIDKAIFHLEQALQINPENAFVHFNLGNALIRQNRADEAIAHYRRALHLEPGSADTHSNLGMALVKSGHLQEAIAHFKQAIQIDPANAIAHNNLAFLLATCAETNYRDGAKAIALATRADELAQGKSPAFLRTLAAAYAEAGEFEKAGKTALRALELAMAQSDTGLVNALQSEIMLYNSELPFHESPTGGTR
jgi:tetratricopeptide (TPR) repeat protein